MTEITVKARSLTYLLNLLEKDLGPRTYYLHNRCGGKNWAVKYSFPSNNFTIELKDAKMAAWLSLKLEHLC